MRTIIFILCLISTSAAFGQEPAAKKSVLVKEPTVIKPENSENVKTAQGVANIMARIGRVGHFGGNKSYEGCGCAMTKEEAYRICCYANSGMKTVDVGYARSKNGMWYCCRRYLLK